MTDRTTLRFLLIGALLVVSGCSTEVGGDVAGGVGVIKQPYLIIPPDWNQYSVVTTRPLRICLDIDPGATTNAGTLQWYVSFAVSAWVTAVQPNSSTQLFSNVDFTCERADNVPTYDFEVVLNPGNGDAVNFRDHIDLYDAEPHAYETVLHELGHSFGMDDTYVPPGGRCRPNQPHSVMCDATFSTLQPDDISGARQAFRTVHPELYSGPFPLTAVSAGRCIDVIGFGTANGTGTQLFDCWPGPTTNQVWSYDPQNRTFIGEGSGKCLDVTGAGKDDGTPVQIWDCNGAPQQQWEPHTDGTIVSLDTGKCLEVANSATDNGSGVQTSACQGGSNQIWSWH